MGFFFERIAETHAPHPSLKVLHTMECKACPLDRAALTHPKIPPSGPETSLIYILGEAPGETEDIVGRQFVGDAGTFLREVLEEIDAPFGQIRWNNVIRCRPTTGMRNRQPDYAEIECCRPSIERDIEQSKPVAIFGFGAVPLHWLIGESGITEWRGRRIPVRVGSHTCWFYPLFHPSYILRAATEKGGGRDIAWTFQFDLERALQDIPTLQLQPVVVSPDEARKGIRLVTHYSAKGVREISTFLRGLDDPDQQVGIDLETNCLRPYASSAKILSIAIATENETLTFPLDHREARWTQAERDAMHQELSWFFLQSRCQKIAHAAAFELEWTYFMFGVPELGRQHWHDTMTGGYCLDERRGMLNLNNLILATFGFPLKALSAIDVKRLDTYPVDEVLRYNGLDAKWARLLFLHHQQVLEQEALLPVYAMQNQRIPTMVLTQMAGLDVDQERRAEVERDLTEKIRQVEQKIQQLPIAQEFERRTYRPMNPASTTDLVYVFQELLRRQEGSRSSGKYSTDESVLTQIDHPLAALILEYRSIVKLYSTYCEGFAVGGKSLHDGDGRVHTSLNTTLTETGRLSSDSPNLQNFPKREDAWIRFYFIPSKGDLFASCDYGQIEARCIGMASKDPVLVKMLRERYDIHQDWAERFVRKFPKLLTQHETMKAMRQVAKNQVVFPALYGSKNSSIARSLGVDEFGCEELMEEFWEIFAGVKQWHKTLFEFYNRTGYVECLTGRRRHHPLSDNKIINSPIQGTASDIVVDAMVRLSEYGRTMDKWQYQARLNVHDDLTFSIPKQSLDQDLEVIIGSMLACPYEFVNVPLSVEVSIGGDWYNMEKVGDFFSDDW